jgi:hypothetical protein
MDRPVYSELNGSGVSNERRTSESTDAGNYVAASHPESAPCCNGEVSAIIA